MPNYRVVITDQRHKNYDPERRVLSGLDVELVLGDCRETEDVAALARDADAVMVDQAPMPADVVQQLKKCKIISRYGVGYEKVDVAAATDRGIFVANVPDYCVDEVSDHALSLLLACARKTVAVCSAVKSGQWNIGERQPVFRMRGKCFGFIGFGKTARALHRKLRGFLFSRFLAYDPFLDAGDIHEYKIELVSREELLANADFISLHAPLTSDSRHIIDATGLEIMKPGTILINTARGGLIDEPALCAALAGGRINSAGLDVYEEEPLPASSPLRRLDNVVLTDHHAWYSEESFEEMKTKVAENVMAVLLGGRPLYPVNELPDKK